MIHFEWSVNIGTIIQIVTSMFYVLGAVVWLGHRLERMDMKINIMWTWWTRRMKIDETDDDVKRFFDGGKGV